MDRFSAMQAFARVVETGSFTKAAETLHISKTSVTQLVQQLEARLRVKLLNRTTRKVNATADGAAYYERVIKLLADMDDAETSLSNAVVSPRGRLRVDVPSPFARMILIPALSDFYALYPDIQLDMGVSDRMVDLIDENVDCVVRGGELIDLSLVARRIGKLSVGIYAAPSYLQKRGYLRIRQRYLLRLITSSASSGVLVWLPSIPFTTKQRALAFKGTIGLRSMMAVQRLRQVWRG
ncbi:LysR family transcriptional regulator [Halomonas sp. TP35]